MFHRKMESRTLEIELQHAKDVNKVNLITKMDVYVIVSISGGDNNSRQKTKSPVDHDGDANPTWNFTMKFTLDEAVLQQNRLMLDFKLVCERSLGDKDIGEVNVPIKELFDSPAKGDGKQISSYQVRKPSGKHKGQLTFAYKFSEKTAAPMPYAGDPATMTSYPAGSSAPYPPPPSGMYPPPVAYPAVASSEAGRYYTPPAGYPSAGVAQQPGGYPPPPPSGYGYPPPPQQGYPPQPGYGYPPPPGYGYPQPVQQPPKKNKFGLGLGAGLLGGAIGGLLIGDIISDSSGCGGGCGGG